ncbi:uncharacterized protein MELLADRAFT_96308 [Melampsora larici-populina 98AG31]|uniref:CxC1-like cysteine cluster associated with KDZ transposases domain-containing protein n=1 Tax=Melampsora larici-populina (strain 98AG31 / pathotype 3-4-7) TaxID=747676 RepID=F4REB4_MELLP|nr:uncharacterized protein MELLADRAFT_96308 [Melampsora larici-populina 98AG31]EGG09298.1 hypothetical protein MELLADRAFT_96308 [Melampsora larici-populina 98AG31]
MGQNRKQLCSNESNEKESTKRTRVTKADKEAEEAEFAKQVEAGKRFFAGRPIHPLNDNDDNDVNLNKTNLIHDNFDNDLNLDEHDHELQYGDFMPFGGLRRPDHIVRIEEFISQHRGYRYARAREDLRQNWEAIKNKMTAAYLQSQTITLNWTTKACYLNDQPRTAFSIPLVQAYHSVWETSVPPSSSFINGNRRDLTQPFSNATHLYSRIIVLSNSILQYGLELTTIDQWAARCSRCFGPSKDEVKVSDEEPDVIVCMDGNFQHQHNILASKDNSEEAQYPAIFMRPSEIAKQETTTALPRPAAPATDEDDPCGEAHKTANDTRGKSTWDQCDDTGLFAMSCRHDVPLLLANIYQSGEKVAVLYDIGCVLDKHITKQNKLPEYQRRLMLGTSVFHVYVHTWGCQLSYNPRFLEFWGLSDGEGLERLWSDLTPLIARLRTSTQLHRLQQIAARCTRGAKLLIDTNPDTFIHPSFSETSGHLKEVTTSECRKRSRFDKRSSWEGCCACKISCIRLVAFQLRDEHTGLELQAFDRLARFQDLATQITELRSKVGLSDTLTSLSAAGQDCFLKVWYAKTEVWSRFLSLRAEQRPLDPENRVGGSSRLGTHEKERIMLAIQKQTRTMKSTLGNYNMLAPLARVQRGQEEVRRLGWEIRRAMRWLTHEHQRLWNILTYLRDSDDNDAALESLSNGSRIDVVKGMVHTAFVKISMLTIHWDQNAMEVIMRTPSQLGDLELMTLWKSQCNRIDNLRASDCASTTDGDFVNLFGPLRVDDRLEQPLANINPPLLDDLSDIEEADWENLLDEGMLLNMMKNVALEN